MDPQDLRAVGGDLEPLRVLSAYRAGLFPMGLGDDGAEPIGWWSPEERGVLFPERLVVSRSLRKARRRFEIRVDTAFEAVVSACADKSRPGAWITDDIVEAYTSLHRAGWAHSIEAWDQEGLAGGLYGIAVGGLFAGESMFHHRTDASKVALMGLVELLQEDPDPRRIIDVQWNTSHLASLGIESISRAEYQNFLAEALRVRKPARIANIGDPYTDFYRT
ncbi:leucyl/phenylalanyl-tRNA--protein transferase [Saxibacter everestensis]|uniref:Leucyl/phenylalanyl-tRNA--protein transferase n=1 Tax=Saxibacter everestensis TaxID=2909229 RepID=A0ABY8QWX8_9MICO|nr:leucyl/phenylalanyl-tRNA--protein transferase [Brevibacteriaceae bacterium ZFBP1038]